VVSRPLIVIVGPTASGKTTLAIELARRLDGEIICADSRTVYKGMDIGTAKPTEEEQLFVPHHLLDVVDPGERFTVADFKRLANEAIIDIIGRGKVPIMVGGSGLYIDAVLFDYKFAPVGTPRDNQNPRHLSKSILVSKEKLRRNTLIVGICVSREILMQRIISRVNQMIDNGLCNEVSKLRAEYPYSKALDAPGYRAIAEYLEGKLSINDARDLFVKNDLRLAKKQMTWFKRNKSIQWITNREAAVELITTFLNKISN